MTLDAFLYQMQRFEEDVAQHPKEMAAFAEQVKLLNNLELLQRDLATLAQTLRGKG